MEILRQDGIVGRLDNGLVVEGPRDRAGAGGPRSTRRACRRSLLGLLTRTLQRLVLKSKPNSGRHTKRQR
jgi:hypothetical protein